MAYYFNKKILLIFLLLIGLIISGCGSSTTGTVKKVIENQEEAKKEAKKTLKSNVKKVPIQDGDVLKTHGSNESIMKLTNVKPSISIEEGIKRFVSWYLNYYNKN